MDTENTVMMSEQDCDMSGAEGWNLKDLLRARREQAEEVRTFPDPAERAAARFPGLEDGVDFGEQISVDDALEHRRDVKSERRVHRSTAQRIAHRHRECGCF